MALDVWHCQQLGVFSQTPIESKCRFSDKSHLKIFRQVSLEEWKVKKRNSIITFWLVNFHYWEEMNINFTSFDCKYKILKDVRANIFYSIDFF